MGPILESLRVYVFHIWALFTEFFWHIVIVVFSLILSFLPRWRVIANPWHKYDSLRPRLHHFLLFLVIVAIFAVSEIKTESTNRLDKMREASSRVSAAFSSTITALTPLESQKDKPNTRDQLIVLRQGITEITTRTYDLVRSSYPQFSARSVSLFLDVGGNWPIEDLVDVGELNQKDWRYLNRDCSFVGSAIKKKAMKYCASFDQGIGECSPLQAPPLAKLQFDSLLCYPANAGSEIVGGICMDSATPNAFGEVSQTRVRDEFQRTLRDETLQLAVLLSKYRNVTLREDPNPPKPLSCLTAHIDDPRPDQPVTRTISCKGTASGFGPQTHLWLAVETGGYLWPKETEIRVLPNGTWEGTIHEDGASDKFDISLLSADMDAEKQIKQWLEDGKATGHFKQLREIPGTERLHRVEGLKLTPEAKQPINDKDN